MSQPELLPCPFCGHTKFGPDSIFGEGYRYVVCGICDTSGPAKRTEAEAIEAWNTRYQPELRPIVIAQPEDETPLREIVANLAKTIETAINETRANTHEIQKIQRQINT